MNIKESTKKAYNKNTKIFEEKFKKLLKIQIKNEIPKFINLLGGTSPTQGVSDSLGIVSKKNSLKKILDLGCGSGDYSVYFQSKGFDITAIDFSNEMVKLAKEKEVNAIEMDIENLKFNNESFDGIWAVTSLLHIEKGNISNVIKKLNEILKKDGILYICIKKGDKEKLIEELNSKRFFAFYQKEEFIEITKNYFKLIDFKELELGNNIFLEFFFKKI